MFFQMKCVLIILWTSSMWKGPKNSKKSYLLSLVGFIFQYWNKTKPIAKVGDKVSLLFHVRRSHIFLLKEWGPKKVDVYYWISNISYSIGMPTKSKGDNYLSLPYKKIVVQLLRSLWNCLLHDERFLLQLWENNQDRHRHTTSKGMDSYR